MKDLTKGSISGNLVAFALPMLIGNIFQQLYNTVDGIIVGKFIGTEAQAAVGACFPLMFLLVSLILGVTMGSTVLISQYYGANDMKSVKKAIDTAYVFLFLSTIILTFVGLVFSDQLLRLMQVPQDVFSDARVYLKIMFAGMIAMFGYNSVSAILRGLGDSKTPMYFLIISTIINIVLDLVFILILEWGIAGVAWSTVIAQGISFICGVYFLNRNHDVFKLDLRNIVFDKDIFITSIKIGLPTGVQQMLVALGMIALQGFVNGFGKTVMAGYFAAGRIDSFVVMPVMSISAAISTFTGQNLGAGKDDRVAKGLWVSLKMSAGLSLVIALVLTVFSKNLMGIFTTDIHVIEIGSSYLRIVAPFYFFISTSFTVTGLLRGAGDTMVPMIISLVTLWLTRIPFAWFFSERIGSDGIWWSIPAGWLLGFVLTFAYYKTGKWKNKTDIGQNRKSNKKVGAAKAI